MKIALSYILGIITSMLIIGGLVACNTSQADSKVNSEDNEFVKKIDRYSNTFNPPFQHFTITKYEIDGETVYLYQGKESAIQIILPSQLNKITNE